MNWKKLAASYACDDYGRFFVNPAELDESTN
jgi:hypothetical protein